MGGWGESSWQAVAVHGVVGCVTSMTGGGKCGPGMLSAGFSQAAIDFKNDLGEMLGGRLIGGAIASAVIGGTASVLGGGKFANGAETAAFGYLFNCARHASCWKVPNDKEANFYRYGTPANGEGSYAQAGALAVIYNLDHNWGEIDLRRIGIGNVSLADDSVFPPHSSHRDGLQIDIRPIRIDGKETGVSWQSPQYDRAATQRMVDILKNNPDVVKVYFNDPNIKGVAPLKGHDDHLHIEVRKGK
ncbi:hypothetical protein, partial [Roseateles aquatilis]|uniref:hypothetical protein n=1 Tax=Roseateles aquatilis TaxID=431061 RepID=UPI00192D0759